MFALHVGIRALAEGLHKQGERLGRLVGVEYLGVLLEVRSVEYPVHQALVKAFLDLGLGCVQVGTEWLEGTTKHGHRDLPSGHR